MPEENETAGSNPEPESCPSRRMWASCALVLAMTIIMMFVAYRAFYVPYLESGAAQLSAVQDDSLDPLTMEVAGGNVVAMVGDGWAQRDGWIQLQLAGGSVPGQSVEKVEQVGSTLYVTIGKGSEGSETTLDLFITEWRVEGSFGGDPVEKVVLKGPGLFGNEETELQKSAS